MCHDNVEVAAELDLLKHTTEEVRVKPVLHRLAASRKIGALALLICFATDCHQYARLACTIITIASWHQQKE